MKRSQRIEHIRKKLLDEGLSIFGEQGYNGTGLKEILDRLKIPKGSFYNYFKSKEEFGAEIIRHYAKSRVAQMDAIFSNSKENALAALKEFFRQVIQMCGETAMREGCLVGNLGAEIANSSEICRQAMAEAMRDMQARFRGVLARAQEEGSIRKDMSAEDLAVFLMNAWQGALIRMKVEASVEPLKKCCSLVLDGFFRD